MLNKQKKKSLKKLFLICVKKTSNSNNHLWPVHSPGVSSTPHVRSCCPGRRVSRQLQGNGGLQRGGHSAGTASSVWSTAAPRRPSLTWTYCSPGDDSMSELKGTDARGINTHTHTHALLQDFLSKCSSSITLHSCGWVTGESDRL